MAWDRIRSVLEEAERKIREEERKILDAFVREFGEMERIGISFRDGARAFAEVEYKELPPDVKEVVGRLFRMFWSNEDVEYVVFEVSIEKVRAEDDWVAYPWEEYERHVVQLEKRKGGFRYEIRIYGYAMRV